MPILNFTKDEVGGNFLGEGTHTVRFTEVDKTKSQAGNDMYVMTLKAANNKTIKEFLPWVPETKWKAILIATAMGFDPNKDIDFPKDLLGCTCTIIVKDTGGKYPNIVGWVPADSDEEDVTDELPEGL